MKNLTVKIFVGLFVVATVLLQSCKKDSETYSFLLNERGAFVEEPGGTTSLGFTAINISSVTPTTVPQGWSVTVDMNERRISVTAPTTFPDDPKTLADGEEEEEENQEGEEEEKKSTKRQGCSCSMKEKRRKQQ